MFTYDLDVKEPRKGDIAAVNTKLRRRIHHVSRELLGTVKDFPDVQIGALRNPGVVVILHRDGVGLSTGRQHILGELGVRHLDGEHIAVFHGDGQTLLGIKRLQTLQCPVVALLIFGNLN